MILTIPSIIEKGKPSTDEVILKVLTTMQSRMEKSDVRMKKIESSIKSKNTQLKKTEKQLEQLATVISNQHQQAQFPSTTIVNPNELLI